MAESGADIKKVRSDFRLILNPFIQRPHPAPPLPPVDPELYSAEWYRKRFGFMPSFVDIPTPISQPRRFAPHRHWVSEATPRPFFLSSSLVTQQMAVTHRRPRPVKPIAVAILILAYVFALLTLICCICVRSRGLAVSWLATLLGLLVLVCLYIAEVADAAPLGE